MRLLPTIALGKHQVTRLICGGNPFSGFSHVGPEMDWDFLRYYTMPNLQAALDECWANGLNTFQSRGDRHQTRMYLEHRLRGGQMQWIAQTASEFRNIQANILEICRYEPIAIYHHGTHTDNTWHEGYIDRIRDIVKFIKDQGLLAGLGTHIPAVIEYAEEHQWETDFYMGCFYNLARGYKPAVAEEQDAYRRDQYPKSDPDRMAATLQQVRKPCLAFKIMAASRNCATPDDVRRTFQWAFGLIKPTDAVVVGMFQKYRNQIQENAQMVRDILGADKA
jgi:hypothetical protein